MKSIAIVGAGGFARELAWLIAAINEKKPTYQFLGFLVSERGAHDSETLGDFSWLDSNQTDCLAMGIGSPGVRSELSRQLKQRFPRIKWPALVHPSVQFGDSVTVNEGSVICANVIATVNVTFEPFTLVNLSCTIGHEAIIGECTVINPLVAISGGVLIGKRVLIGTHSAILQYVKIGDEATIGAGALVNREVESGSTVVGVPARER